MSSLFSSAFQRCLWHLLLLGFVVLTTLVVKPAPAFAVDDPALNYHTITTPHFYVHYYDGLEALAKKVAVTSEEAHLILSPLLKWTPAGRTHVNVIDQVDTANGSANAYGRNVMNIFGMPPESDSTLGYYDDWIRILVFHEYVHVLHLDTFDGVSKYINYVVGKQIRPNQVLPRWYVEGLAVFYESFITGTGRINGSLYKMWMRAEATRQQPLKLGAVTHNPTCWPLGSTAYLYGAYFIDWIARRHGPYFLTQFNHLYGSRIIPFGMNQAAREISGESFESMWHAWRAEQTEEAKTLQKKIFAKGKTPIERVTFEGGRTKYPRIRPGHNAMTYYWEPLDAQPSFMQVETQKQQGATPKKLFGQFATFGAGYWFPDGERLLFSQRTVTKSVYSYEDLFVWDTKTNTTTQLTHSDRAREPAISPDGTQVVYVRNRAGTMELVWRQWKDGGFYGPERILVSGLDWKWDDDRHWQQIATPTFTPDGSAVVFSGWRLDLRQRDLWLVSLKGKGRGRLTPLMRDAAVDIDPHFGPDGTLYFSSDRTGIYNIYSMDLQTRNVQRLSHVFYGAFSPQVSEDGLWIYHTTYGEKGYDIARMKNPLTKPTDTSTKLSVQNEQVLPWRRYPEVSTKGWTTEPYQPTDSLAPLFFIPDVALVTSGVGFGGTLSGYDSLQRHLWTLTANIVQNEQFDVVQPNLIGAYAYRGWAVDTQVQVGHIGITNPSALFAESRFVPFLERRMFGTLTLTYPVLWPAQSVFLSTSYTLERGMYWGDRPRLFHDPADLEPRYPKFEFNHRLSFSMTYSNIQRYGLSVSPEEGMSLFAATNLSGRRPLEEGWESLNVFVGFQGFIPLTLLHPGHVLSLSASTGFFANISNTANAYSVGGFGPDNWLLDLVWQGGSPSQVVRGYPAFVMAGDSFVLTSGQWRFPILGINEGFSTAPLFFRWLKGRLFLDAGTAYRDYLADAEWIAGAGAEILLDTTIGYYLPGQLRLGWARGLIGEEAIQEAYLLYGGGF